MAGPNGPNDRSGGSGGAWVTWVVVLIIIGVGIWLIFAWTAGPAVVQGPAAPQSAGAAPITAFADLGGIGADWQEWLRREVQFASVPVWTVYPGKGLFIGTSERLYFVRATTMPPLAPGDNVSLIGEIGRLPADPGKEWGLPQEAASRLQNETIYIQATSLERVPPGGAEAIPTAGASPAA